MYNVFGIIISFKDFIGISGFAPHMCGNGDVGGSFRRKEYST
jgi:hypothetical protein